MVRYLYKITNKINGRYYIGVHTAKNENDYYMGSGTALKLAIKKYGKKNFMKEILEYFENDSDMFNRERETVDKEFIKNPNTYNIMLGGKGLGGGIDHPLFGEKRGKHSELMKNNNPMKGTKRPESVKLAISKANTGRKHSDEVNKKKGSLGVKNFFYGKEPHTKGKTWINDGEKNMIVDLKVFELLPPWKLGVIPMYGKPVYKIDRNTDEIICEYKSLAEAGRMNAVSHNSISNCCSGRLRSAGGYKWKRKNEIEENKNGDN